VNWTDLNVVLRSCTEAEVKRMLDEEVTTHRRSVFIKRLHQRFTTLRATRERKELLEAIKRV
jgi:hypothetical protein